MKEFGISTTRTIIYCQTIKQYTMLYSIIRGMLGNKLFTGELNDRRHVLIEMLHSCTPEPNNSQGLSGQNLRNPCAGYNYCFWHGNRLHGNRLQGGLPNYSF